ncbi:MAG: glycosyltransferase family 39 protein [Roseiflexus sp.]|nr:glycosyltransferase family 39 protein [Roseiflexus sp.]MDW8148963.1 glycosyltransferase family 39 protein [Roseiflexaceae bacterium]
MRAVWFSRVKPAFQLKVRSQMLLAWTVALVCVACGAWWQLDAVSSQHVSVGSLTDGSYVVGFYDREITTSGSNAFRWAPAQGGALQFWPLPAGVPAVLSLNIYRPSPAMLTLHAGDRQVRFGVDPGRRMYRLLVNSGDKRIALTVSPKIVVANDPRALGFSLSNAGLMRMARVELLDLIATFFLVPFLPLALAGLSWFSAGLDGRYCILLTPLTMAAVIGAGEIWPVWRLEIAWLVTHLILIAVMSAIMYRLARRWLASRLHDDRTLVAIVFSMGMLTLLLTFVPRISSDGVGYYAYARSLVYRGDLVMDETFAELYAPHSLRVTDRGLLANPWSVGPAAIWIGPLMLYRLLFGGNGHEIGAYATICLISALAGPGTMIVAYCCARRWFSPAASALGALTAFYGSTLWFYSMREGSFAHALSAFACALVLLAWLRVIERPSPGRWIMFGAAAGMMALIYWATTLILIAPLSGIAYLAWRARNNWQEVARIAGGCLAAGFTALVVFSPQLIVWFLIYGSPLIRPPGTPYIVWNDPHILELFTARFGLARWSPAAMIGLLGLLLLVRRNPVTGGALLVAALVYIAFNGLLNNWHGSGTFGTRRLTSLAVWYALGLAAIAEALIRSRRTLLALSGVVACSGWMLMLIVRTVLGYMPKGVTAFGLETMSSADLYLVRDVLPTLEFGEFLRSGFVWDTLITAPPDFSVRILPYLALLSGLAVWAFWRLAVSDLRSCDACVPQTPASETPA